MKRIRSFSLFLSAALLGTALLHLLVGPASAQTARAYSRADSISVGERFDLTVVVERPVWARTVFTHPPHDSTGQVLQIADILILRTLLDTSPAASESGIDSVVYEATTFALDTAIVGPVPVGIVATGDTLAISADPFWIPVRSVVPGDAEDILDLMPIAEFPPAIWPWLVFLGLLIAATGAFLWWYRHSPQIVSLLRSESEIKKSPLEEATERLAALEDADLSTDETVKAFFVELSETLRTYISRRLEVPALERTSRELLDDIRDRANQDLAPLEMIEVASLVLQTSDLAKFAELFPAQVVCRQSIERVRNVLEMTEAFLTPEDEVIIDESALISESE